MVVAVIAVRVVQVAIHQIIDMVAVGDRLVAACWAVAVILRVSGTAVLRRAAGGVGRVDCQLVFLDLGTLDVVQMAVVQVIDVAIMQNPGVAAIGAVLVRVSCVMSRHDQFTPFRAALAGFASSSSACARAF
jgi:hypothetical protein